MPDSPTTRRPQVQRSAEARHKLLTSAASLIAERGLPAVTLAEVGRRAGYSRGIANHHFGTKAELISQMIDQVEREFLDATAPAASLAGSVEELIGTAEVFLDVLTELPVTDRAFLVLWATSVADPDLAVRMNRSDTAFRQSVTAVLERGRCAGEVDPELDAEAYAAVFLGQLRGIALQYLLMPSAIDLARVRPVIVETIRRTLHSPLTAGG